MSKNYKPEISIYDLQLALDKLQIVCIHYYKKAPKKEKSFLMTIVNAATYEVKLQFNNKSGPCPPPWIKSGTDCIMPAELAASLQLQQQSVSKILQDLKKDLFNENTEAD